MRREIISVLGGLLVIGGCSSNSSPDPAPSTPVPTRTLSVTERLQAALLSENTMTELGFDTFNEGSRFDPTENTSYSLAAQCRVTLATDRRITGEWQSSYGEDTEFKSIDQVVVGYRGGAADALAEARAKFDCARDVDVESAAPRTRVTAPTVPGAFVSCLRYVRDDSVTCTVIIADGDYASATTVTGPRLQTVSSTVAQLVPRLRTALAGRQSTAPPPPSGSPTAASTAASGAWTLEYARVRFAAMEKDRGTAEECVADLARYADKDAEARTVLPETAGNCSDAAKTFGDNLAAGRWPASVRPAVDRLRTALGTQRLRYAAVELAGSLEDTRAAFGAAVDARERTEQLRLDVHKALGD